MIKKKYPNLNLASLFISKYSILNLIDNNFLKDLESDKLPSIKSIIQSDTVLRNLTINLSLRYITTLGYKIVENIKKHKPDLVLASYDGAHSSLSLLISKKLNVPWVTLNFTNLPRDYFSFNYNLNNYSIIKLIKKIKIIKKFHLK